MPPVPVPPEQYLVSMITQLRTDVDGIATNQQTTLTDEIGRAVVNIGLAPASNPAQYGIQLVNPATGGQLAMFGVQEDGTVSQSFFDGNGNLRTKIDAAGQHFYDGSGNQLVTIDSMGLHVWNSSGQEITRLDGTGLHSYDATTAERVRAGHLASGDYGLQVTDSSGNTEEVLPAVESFAANVISVTSTSYVSDGGPSVTAVVGASGKVKLDASAQLESNSAGDGVYVGLFIDGSAWTGGGGSDTTALLDCFSVGGQTLATCAVTVVLAGLTPGSHTFELQYRHSSGTNAGEFWNRSLLVTPL
ncbi:hypothetical protein K6U06_19770 [Acidiferrimicrobium sp. IK]|uniref:hypothetical protein n=1 Tax=Acidiferrimicrobium sp. IK TaxID=2871700 RepID=UPI0021CB6D36|nr:hypothetical protein [Acidiferrimicrobium sp. IK]MCU4186613.1 hypothetical protein [Acidiferrimicrobium sp. IK]